jgi:tetratricopeptide (TPR) repeat protein
LGSPIKHPTMKNSAKTFFLFLIFTAWFSFGAHAQLRIRPMLPSSGATSYANLPISKLNQAHREQRTGQFEIALLTYNSALAYQPNWVPALTGRAELLYRLGRNLEARKDHTHAQRMNPTATAFFLSRGHNGLLPFLALYPQDWYTEQYGFSEEYNPEGKEDLTPQAYFTHQYLEIIGAVDTGLAVRFLREKVEQNILKSKALLRELPRDYNPAVKSMLEANLAMLNHDYSEAINLYTDAESRLLNDWPELHYNRGLGYILLHNYMNGCADLSEASRAGFAPAEMMYSSLCNL